MKLTKKQTTELLQYLIKHLNRSQSNTGTHKIIRDLCIEHGCDAKELLHSVSVGPNDDIVHSLLEGLPADKKWSYKEKIQQEPKTLLQLLDFIKQEKKAASTVHALHDLVYRIERPLCDVHQIHALEDAIIDFLTGRSIAVVNKSISVHCNQCPASTLFRTIQVNKNDNIVSALYQGLTPEAKANCQQLFEEQTFCNLYDLLKKLSVKGHGNHHLRTLLAEIDSIHPPQNWAMISFIGAILSASTGLIWGVQQHSMDRLLAWLEQTSPRMLSWLNRTFSLLKNVALLAIIANSLNLIWSWYVTFTSDNESPRLWQKLLFKTASSGLTIGAYLVLALTSGAANTLSAFLFLFSASFNVLESVFRLTEKAPSGNDRYFGYSFEWVTELPREDELEENILYLQKTEEGLQYTRFHAKTKEKWSDVVLATDLLNEADSTVALERLKQMTQLEDLRPYLAQLLDMAEQNKHIEKSWGTYARYLRDENYYEYSQKTAWIRLGLASLSTAAVLIWCFSPPSLLLSVCCMSFNVLMNVAQCTWINATRRHQAHVLQEKLSAIDQIKPIELQVDEYRRLDEQLKARDEALKTAKRQFAYTVLAQGLRLKGKHKKLDQAAQRLVEKEAQHQHVIDAQKAKAYDEMMQFFSRKGDASSSREVEPAVNVNFTSDDECDTLRPSC